MNNIMTEFCRILGIKSIFMVAFLVFSFYSFSAENRTISYLNDQTENHKMDIYYSTIGNKNPINVLAIPAGGFVMTDKDDLKEKAIELSKLGYNIYVPNYSDVMYSEVCKKSHKIWYNPLQELNAALAWIEKNENVSEVYLYGESAGGILALNLSYLENSKSLVTELNKDFGPITKLGSHSIKVKGVFTISAGVFDLSIFSQKSLVPLLMIHATCDQMVSYNSGTPLMCDEEAIVVYGSNAIFEHIKELKTVPQTRLLSICNANHDITDNNFLESFESFVSQIEKQENIKLKKETLKIELTKNEMVQCSVECK